MMSSSFFSGMDLAKAPLLPSTSQPKKKKEPKTYVFQLELGESNDQSCPEFSWAELVRDAKEKEAEERKKQGGTTLDPFASDDEDDLKEMAARFEEKYGNQTSSKQPSKKKKRRVDDCDRGAGYDDNDSFIDNTDAYDEKVPQELQPAYGGFYINSGQLDSKEVQISDDDDDDSDEEEFAKQKLHKEKLVKSDNVNGKTKKTLQKANEPVAKKRRLSQNTPIGRPKVVQGEKKNPNNNRKEVLTKAGNSNTTEIKKRRLVVKSSSSSSSSDSSSSSSSSDDSSDDSSSSATDEKQKGVGKESEDSDIIILHSTTPGPVKSPLKKYKKRVDGTRPINKATIRPTTIPPVRPRVKNVPLNPNLKRDSTGVPSKNATAIPPATITRKIISAKDMVKLKQSVAATGPITNPKLKPTAPKKPQLSATLKNTSSSPATISSPTVATNQTPTPKSTPTSVIKTANMSQKPTPPASLSVSVTNTNTPSKSSCASPLSTPSPLSLSAELALLFPSTEKLSQNPINTPPPLFKKKASPPMMNSAEMLAKEMLSKIQQATSGTFQKNKSPATIMSTHSEITKPLPSLKKIGITVEKQQLVSGKNLKANPKLVAISPTSLVNVSKTSPSQYNNISKSMASSYQQLQQQQQQQPKFTSGGVEISRVSAKQPLPALGAGITVTEVKDKSCSPSNFAMKQYNAGGNLHLTAHSLSNSNFNPTSVKTSSPNSSSILSLTNPPKITHSVTITPSSVISMTGESPERFNLSMNNRSKSNTGYSTSFDVNSILSNSNKLAQPQFQNKPNNNNNGMLQPPTSSQNNISFQTRK